MKTTITVRTSSKPHVKWGHLLGAIAITLVALLLIILNMSRTIFGYVAIDVFIGYGPFVALFLLLIAGLLLMEDFLPSFAKRKAWKKKKAYVAAVKSATMESVKSNLRYERAQMNEFLKAHPQYRW